MRRDDDDDRSGEAGRSEGGASWVDRVVIPDDISELDAEIRALQRERRAQRRREWLRRLVGSGRGTGLLLVAVLLIAGMAGLLVLFQPRRTSSNVTPVDGTAQATDRLLPDVLVRLVDGTSRKVREFSPAVLVLAPIGCSCDPALRDVGTAAHRHGVSFLMVDRTVPPLPRGLAAATAIRLAEPSGELARRYDAEEGGRRRSGGPVTVLVGDGGQVVRVLQDASATTLEHELSAIEPKVAPAS